MTIRGILKEFRQEIEKLYGERLKEVILYGLGQEVKQQMNQI